jgi:hypothetical protein
MCPTVSATMRSLPGVCSGLDSNDILDFVPCPLTTAKLSALNIEQNFRATIAGFHKEDEKFVVYRILVEDNDKLWRVSRRFSEFCDFHEQLKKTGDILEELKKSGVPLPSAPSRFSIRKLGVGKLSEAVFCMRRQAQLQEYLDRVLEIRHTFGEPETALLLNFLGVDSTSRRSSLASVPEDTVTSL